MPTFAAVDIGANSVRLKIARLVRNKLVLVHEDREVVRLGESVFATSLLAPPAMAHTVKVMRRFRKAVQEHGDVIVRVAATSALRDARNSQAFIDWVHMRTGWTVEVISGVEEARLIHLGVISNLRLHASPLLLMDLGGGSCELTLSDQGQIRETISLPLGAVRLTQHFLHHDPPRKYEMERLYSFIGEELERVDPKIRAAAPKLVIATSGTAAALATAAHTVNPGSRGSSVTAGTAVKLARILAKRSYPERNRLPGIGTRRAEIIIAGAAVFAEILQRCGLAAFRYSPLGLRDGLLQQMASDYSRHSKPTEQLASERWRSLLAAGKHYHLDLEQAQHIRKLAMDLFASLRLLHRLPPEYEEWLSAAAMLHEAGVYINRTGWHRHAYYIIANSEVLGYTPAQRRIIAAMARYLGRMLPSSGDKVIRALDSQDQDYVPKAVVLLRLARALNQGRRRVVTGVVARARDGRVLLQLKTKRGAGADLEMWALKRERAYFRAVLGRDLEAETV